MTFSLKECYQTPTEQVDDPISSTGAMDQRSNIKLTLPPIEDKDYPSVSIVMPTYKREKFIDLMFRNWKKINYPRDRLEWIVVDDSPTEKTKLQFEQKLRDEGFDKDLSIKFIRIDYHMDLGQKRNLLGLLSSNQYIVHMDDDDFYPHTSVAARIRVLLEFEKKIGRPGIVGCTHVNCYDLITDQVFEAFDKDPETGDPTTISESTLAYNSEIFKEKQFRNEDNQAECRYFLQGRLDQVCIMPSSFVVTQLTHSSNTINRRLLSENPYGMVCGPYGSTTTESPFTENLTVKDVNLINDLRVLIIREFPEWRKAMEVVSIVGKMNTQQAKKFFKRLDKNGTFSKNNKKDKKYDRDLLKNPLVIQMRKEKLVTKEKSTGKDIVYYCGPGKFFKFSSEWNPESKTIGGSEEAVINLSREFAEQGYNVTVYCVLAGPAKMYQLGTRKVNVRFRPYWEWIPSDKQDLTILWRDPSLAVEQINSDKICLDLHDAINPKWLTGIPENVTLMTKSRFHAKILDIGDKCLVIPNGISADYSRPSSDKKRNLMVCTSSPDRCLRALLRALPLIRKEVPDAEIHWAYGFSAGVSKGGMEKDAREEVRDWVSETKRLIEETEGFVNLGRLSQKEIVKLYQKAEYYVYGTNFPEIDCISLTKAMASGCTPIVSPAGAMAEKIGQMDKEYSELKPVDYLDTSLKEGPEFDKWVSNIIQTMKTNSDDYLVINNIYEKYNWKSIANEWLKLIDEY